MLTMIEGAVGREDWRPALEAALAWWRDTRAPEVAELVDLLAARLKPKPIPQRGPSTFQDRWLAAVAADPIGNLGPALATLARSVNDGGMTDEGCWLRRMDALAPLADPRIAAAFVAQLRQYPLDEFWNERRGASYEPLFAGLARLGDVRQVEPLRELVARPVSTKAWVRKILADGIPRVADAVAARPPAPLPESTGVRALVARLAPPAAPNDDELLALVYASPDDDGPREVLADRWLERGDPRGTFVTLQLRIARGTATPADRKKSETLLRKHEKAWLGPLGQVTKQPRVWRRGFLDSIELHAPTFGTAPVWLAAERAPDLATVRVVRQGNQSEEVFRRFVKEAPNLREVRAYSAEMFAELLARPPARLEGLAIHFAPDRANLAAIAAAFPRLTRIHFPLRKVAWQIAEVAAFADGRKPPFLLLGSDGGLSENCASLAPWLEAVRGPLAPLGEVTLLIGPSSVAASAGESGLRLRLTTPDLHYMKRIVPALAPIEHVHLGLSPGAPPPDNVHRLYEKLLAPLPGVTVDEAWRKAIGEG